MSALPAEKKKYTWKDYQAWPVDERWELIDGEAFAMSPSPKVRHQKILVDLTLQLGPQFKGHRCQLLIAPLDVKFDEFNCTEPDLLIVCDPRQVKSGYIDGPPALVVEILSDSSLVRDRVRKMKLYARFGVKEYWIITPWPPMLEVFHLDGATYRVAGSFRKEDEFRSPTFPEMKLNFGELFDYPPGPEDVVEVVKEPPAAYGAV